MERAHTKREHLPIRRLQAWLLLIAAVLVASLMIGCSASQNGHTGSMAARVTTPAVNGSPAARRLARDARFIRTADAICRRLNSELTLQGAEQGANYLTASTLRNARLEWVAVGRLTKLRPPAWMAADWAEMNADKRILVEQLEQFARYAQARETRAMQALALSKLRLHKRLLQTAAHDGFADCAQVGTSLKPPRAGSPASLPASSPSRSPGGGR